MAHKTKINGTNYDVSGGKTLVGGTAYTISKGKTLVNGTAYTITFAKTIYFMIEGVGSFTTTEGTTWAQWADGDGYSVIESYDDNHVWCNGGYLIDSAYCPVFGAVCIEDGETYWIEGA